MALTRPDPNAVILAGLLVGTLMRESERCSPVTRSTIGTDAALLFALSWLRLDGAGDAAIVAQLRDLAARLEAGTLEFYPWREG